jgi:hypothetical protein
MYSPKILTEAIEGGMLNLETGNKRSTFVPLAKTWGTRICPPMASFFCRFYPINDGEERDTEGWMTRTH